jgi:hypothetical protein
MRAFPHTYTKNNLKRLKETISSSTVSLVSDAV